VGEPARVKRLCVITTSDLIVRFFLGELLRELGGRYELSLVVNTRDAGLASHARLRLVPMAIERRIAPLADLRALWQLWRHFRRARYDGVISLAPKAGLLVALAARAAGIRFRCHVFQGEVWAVARGPKRRLLKALDRLVGGLSSHVLVISPSERAFLEREGIVASGRARLIANGSLCGVDPERFRPDAQWREQVRSELGIAHARAVVLFLGRITRDKGVLDLAQAFQRLVHECEGVYLVYVGPDEGRLERLIRESAGKAGDRLRFVPYTETPERYIAAADLVALPSYREGFGNVVIEAAAAGIPSVASRIYGISDALIDGETGLLHPPGDAAALAAALKRLLQDAPLRRRLGEQARHRALREYASRDVLGFWLRYLAERV
jgi:glycosyltransferase involved in cell wall biosynthesis